MEVAFPIRVIGLDAACQLAYVVVLAVPLGQVLNKVLHRIVSGNEVRVDVAVQVLVPGLNASLQSLDSHGVTCRLIQRQESIAHGVQAIFWRSGHDIQTQGIVFLHIGLGLVGKQGRRARELQRYGFQRLAQVGRAENGINGFLILQTAKHRDKRTHTGTPGLRQTHLATAIGQMFQDGIPEHLGRLPPTIDIIPQVTVCLLGGIKAVVETAHAAVVNRQARNLLWPVIVADSLLHGMELRRLFGFCGYGDGKGLWIVVGLCIIAGLATGLERRLILCQRCAELRSINIMVFAEGVQQGLTVER